MSDRMKTSRIGLRVAPEDKETLREWCERNNYTMSGLIRDLVEAKTGMTLKIEEKEKR